MPRKSSLKEITCLVASMKFSILSQKNNDLQNAQNIEALYKYGIELFNGISRNESNSFEGNFDYSVLITPQHFLIYKKLKNDTATEQEYEEFLTAIAIFQMVFIDEKIFLSGTIDLKDLIISKDGIIWGDIYNSEYSMITVKHYLSKLYKEKFTKKMGDHYILDFLPTVYRFHPFKDEEGNLMRHIVTPINAIKKEYASSLSELITYCTEYIAEKNFALKL